MPKDISTPYRRTLGWLDMVLLDHGFVRAIYNNLYDLGGGMYRSSQVSPAQIRKYQHKYGLKSIINLRGFNEYGTYFFEVETCQQQGIALHDTKLYSRNPPSVSEIHGMRDLFQSVAYPALMHCKSGADRAGLAATLYRILHLNHPVSDAISELSWKYGHFKRARTGVIDFFFANYLAYHAHTPIDFMAWVETVYDEEETKQRFNESGWASLIVDKVLHRE